MSTCASALGGLFAGWLECFEGVCCSLSGASAGALLGLLPKKDRLRPAPKRYNEADLRCFVALTVFEWSSLKLVALDELEAAKLWRESALRAGVELVEEVVRENGVRAVDEELEIVLNRLSLFSPGFEAIFSLRCRSFGLNL